MWVGRRGRGHPGREAQGVGTICRWAILADAREVGTNRLGTFCLDAARLAQGAKAWQA